jgi:hypothetical protein
MLKRRNVMAACISTEKAASLLAQHKGFAWIDGGVLKLGKLPFHEEYALDFASESLTSSKRSSAGTPVPASVTYESPRDGLVRRGGRYMYFIKGEYVACGSYKELLKKGILAIEKHYPALLPELAKVKGRTRRIVATKPGELFNDLALSKFAEPLKPGWFYGTNNNKTTTRDWLKLACEIAGLKWGEDFEVSI